MLYRLSYWGILEAIWFLRSLCVGIVLSSQAVTSQVLSALMSLTTVFGMGTGVPSSQLTPTYFSFSEKYICYYNTFLRYVKKKLVTRGRIELPFTAWEAVVLAAWPTGHFHTPYFLGVLKKMVHHRGLEPRTHWLRVSCSTNWANGAKCRQHQFSQAVARQVS